MSRLTAADLIQSLGLKPHPEGGHYVETFRSELVTQSARGTRSASTAIYFLLKPGEFSAFHRVTSDEVWHHYAGAPVELHLIDDDGRHLEHRLGKALHAGERPQWVVPAGVWQAARASAAATEPTLCGCTVAPGFEFSDFELPRRETLVRRFPRHAELIARLTRD